MKNTKLFSQLLILFVFFCLQISYLSAQVEEKADSLINTNNETETEEDALEGTSELVIKFDYANKTVFAGRDYGLNQFSLIPDIAYYHKSGFFGSVSGYYYSQYNPAYNLTVASFGYSGDITNIWSISTSYSRNFFTPTEPAQENPIKNSLSLFTGLDFNFLNFGANYSLLFGDETAHSLTFNLGSLIRIKDVGFIDRILISPTITAFLGNESATLSRFRQTQIFRRAFFQRFQEEKNAFGLMNLDFALPVKFRIGDFRLGVTYHYSVPFDLIPEDELDVSPIGFFTISVSYSINNY